MPEHWFNGLALLYVYRNIDLDIDEIINRFSYKKTSMTKEIQNPYDLIIFYLKEDKQFCTKY